MIFIVTALKIEALPIIQNYHLKKNINNSKFNIYKNEKIQLIISGTGKVKSAIATTYLLSQYNDWKKDKNNKIINFGICGSKNKTYNLGQMIFINKIVDFSNKLTFSTFLAEEIQLKHASLSTSETPITSGDNNLETDLVDMEGIGFFQAANNFLEKEDIIMLKIVSDYLEAKKLSKEDVWKWVESNIKILNEFLF